MQQTECAPARGVRTRQSPEVNTGINPELIAATTVIGDRVKGSDGKDLGRIEEIMLDLTAGTIVYLVFASGGILGIGDKFLAIPLDSLSYDAREKVFYLDIDKEKLKKIPGFDKDRWPKQPEWPPAQ